MYLCLGKIAKANLIFPAQASFIILEKVDLLSFLSTRSRGINLGSSNSSLGQFVSDITHTIEVFRVKVIIINFSMECSI